MSQGNDFANYSAASNATSGGSEEVWFVAVASDDIKQMTIDQLDEAFRLGVITGDTPVWTEGMDAWSPLAQVADLDGDSGSEASGSHAKVEEPLAGRHASPGQSGVSHAVGSHSGSSHSGASGSGGTGSFGAAPSMSSGAMGSGFGAVTLQSVQHSYAPGPSSVAPVTASYAPSGHAGQSSVPVAIGDDEELPQAKRGGFRPARWALAGAAAVIAVGVIAYNNLSSSVASAGTEAASAAPALAARPYDGADGAERGASASAAKPAASADDTAPASAGSGEPAAPAPSSGSAAVASAAAAASTTAKAALVASPSADEDEPPASSRRGADRESLKNTFSKSLTKKASAKAAKVKPRKAASRATKSRATKGSKKPAVVRSQSAFDPLNDSLP
jgi:uncharacterized protein DUF4339